MKYRIRTSKERTLAHELISPTLLNLHPNHTDNVEFQVHSLVWNEYGE